MSEELDRAHAQVIEFRDENKKCWDKLHAIRKHMEPLQAEFPHPDGFLGQHVAAIIALIEGAPDEA